MRGELFFFIEFSEICIISDLIFFTHLVLCISDFLGHLCKYMHECVKRKILIYFGM